MVDSIYDAVVLKVETYNNILKRILKKLHRKHLMN